MFPLNIFKSYLAIYIFFFCNKLSTTCLATMFGRLLANNNNCREKCNNYDKLGALATINVLIHLWHNMLCCCCCLYWFWYGWSSCVTSASDIQLLTCNNFPTVCKCAPIWGVYLVSEITVSWLGNVYWRENSNNLLLWW